LRNPPSLYISPGAIGLSHKQQSLGRVNRLARRILASVNFASFCFRVNSVIFLSMGMTITEIEFN